VNIDEARMSTSGHAAAMTVASHELGVRAT